MYLIYVYPIRPRVQGVGFRGLGFRPHKPNKGRKLGPEIIQVAGQAPSEPD